MSTHVVIRLRAGPGRGSDLESLLLEILGESAGPSRIAVSAGRRCLAAAGA